LTTYAEPAPVHTAPEPAAEHATAGSRKPTMILAALAVIAALWLARVLLITFVLAGLLGYALDPVQRRLVAWGLHRSLAAVLVLAVLIGGVAGAGALLRSQAVGFAGQLPVVTQRLRAIVRAGAGAKDGAMEQVQRAATELKKAADEAVPPPASGVTRVQVEQPGVTLSDLLWRGSLSAFEFAAQATIMFFLVYYLLANGDLYKRKIIKIAGPALSSKRVTLEILNQIAGQIERFLMARVLVSLMVGVATGLAFWSLGISQPGVWGVGAGVLNTVPYLGPCAVALAAFLAGLLEFGSGTMALELAFAASAIACLEGFIITPWLMGRAGRMNAGAVFVGLSFWGWIWGIWGLLLAVPIMMVIKAVCDHVEGWKPVSELLSD
jgi:predicted PurR-regulated permease PerM